jgi:hypothetical protein
VVLNNEGYFCFVYLLVEIIDAINNNQDFFKVLQGKESNFLTFLRIKIDNGNDIKEERGYHYKILYVLLSEKIKTRRIVYIL